MVWSFALLRVLEVLQYLVFSSGHAFLELVFVTNDAVVDQLQLQVSLRSVVEEVNVGYDAEQEQTSYYFVVVDEH